MYPLDSDPFLFCVRSLFFRYSTLAQRSQGSLWFIFYISLHPDHALLHISVSRELISLRTYTIISHLHLPAVLYRKEGICINQRTFLNFDLSFAYSKSSKFANWKCSWCLHLQKNYFGCKKILVLTSFIEKKQCINWTCNIKKDCYTQKYYKNVTLKNNNMSYVVMFKQTL